MPATGAVGQVGGTTSPSDRDVIRIPSLDPQGSGTRSQVPQGSGTRSEFGDNRAPLTGPPSDRDNVEQPRLESARPRTDDYYRGYADGLYRGDVKSNRYERDLPSRESESRYRESEYTQPRNTQPRETTPPLPTESPAETRARQAESRYVEPKFRYDENSYKTIEDTDNDVEQSSYWQREATPRTDVRSNLPELNAPLTSKRYSPHQTQTTPRIPSPFRVRPNTPVTLEDTVPLPSAGMTREPDNGTYSTLRPIQAPADLREPFPNHSLADQTPDRDGWQARTSSNSASTRVSVPVRGATAGPRDILGTATKKPAPRNQQRFTREPTPAKKSVTYDSDGWLPL